MSLERERWRHCEAFGIDEDAKWLQRFWISGDVLQPANPGLLSWAESLGNQAYILILSEMISEMISAYFTVKRALNEVLWNLLTH